MSITDIAVMLVEEIIIDTDNKCIGTIAYKWSLYRMAASIRFLNIIPNSERN